MRILILTFIILSCIFIVGCEAVPTMDNSLPTDWSDAMVKEYFDSIPSVLEFSKSLINKGYRWDSDGLNITLLTDTFATPNRVLGQGYGNCNDLMALFTSYCIAEEKADEITQYLALNSNILENQWHYYSIIKDKDKWYHQSNLSICEIKETIEAQLYWTNKGYNVIIPWKVYTIQRSN